MCLRLPVFALYLFCHAALAFSDQWYVVSMGDSITSGFNTRWPGDIRNARYNWATGVSARVESHLHKLKKIIPLEIKAINVAKSRSTSFHLAEQLEGAKDRSIDYLTLQIGANDVCNWTEEYAADLRKFRTNVQYIINKAIASNAEVRIVLSAIPNMYRLYELGKDTCGARWDYFEACPRLLSSERNNWERLAFRDRLVAANEALAQLSAAYVDNVKFIGEVYDFEFSIEHLSRIDCFHPSIRGQNELARVTWENGWYL